MPTYSPMKHSSQKPHWKAHEVNESWSVFLTRYPETRFWFIQRLGGHGLLRWEEETDETTSICCDTGRIFFGAHKIHTAHRKWPRAVFELFFHSPKWEPRGHFSTNHEVLRAIFNSHQLLSYARWMWLSARRSRLCRVRLETTEVVWKLYWPLKVIISGKHQESEVY